MHRQGCSDAKVYCLYMYLPKPVLSLVVSVLANMLNLYIGFVCLLCIDLCE